MDPFSLAVGVAGLLGLAAKTIELTKSYIHGARRATEAANELLEVLTVLRSTLLQLDKMLKNDKKDTFSNTSVLVKSTDACRNKLTTLHNKLQETVKQPLQRLRWPLNANSHREMLQDIRTFTQWIQFALTIDGSLLLSKTSDEVVEVLSNQLRMFQSFSQLETGAHFTHTLVQDTYNKILDLDAATERDKVLDWISVVKPEQKHYDMRLRRLEGTGEWLLQNPCFKQWHDQSIYKANTLWCYGIPGSGKSILASLVIDHLRYAAFDTQSLVAHIYFDYKDQEYQSLGQILASLLKQVAGAQPELPPIVNILYRRLKRQQKVPQQQDIVQALLTICREQKKVYFVIDALDECDPRLRKSFIEFLGNSKVFASIFVTSRSYPSDITKSFEFWPQIEIKADSSDLRIYILEAIDQSDWRGDIADSFKEKIADKIIAKAQGMFLLAVLHIKTVLSEPTLGQMAEALDHLPSSLEAAFEETMQRIRSQQGPRRKLGLDCLMWISYAKRPLTVEELGDALAITINPSMTSVDSDYRPPENKMIDSCHGLIIMDEESRVGFHVEGASDTEVDRNALNFLQAKQELACSLQLWQYTQGRRKEYCQDCEAITCNGLHVAAMFGLSNVARELLPKYPIDSPTNMGTTALIKAASCGFPDLAKLFLSMDADPYKNNWYGTALHCAAEAGQLGTIQALLDAGVDVNLKDKHDRAPLLCAAQSGHTGAMRALLDHGADVNVYSPTRREKKSRFSVKVNRRRAPLMCTAQPGHAGAIRTLLGLDADVNLRHERSTTLFNVVLLRESLDVIQTLLVYHADPNISTDYGDVPLHMAASQGDIVVAQMLLDYGAEIDTPGRTVLHTAALFGHVQLVDLFLDRGAAIDAQSRDGSTSLHLAVEESKVESVKLLLEKGANFEIANNSGLTPLHIAARNNDPEVLQRLIDAGADRNARDMEGMTALELATKEHSWDAHKLLSDQSVKDQRASFQVCLRLETSKSCP
ncbi:MAG: hypothetical protein Q9225_006922 [Loekoesia sp. 1 TL-2023]